METSSSALLLSTKLKIPAPRKNYIVRKSLFDKLSQCADLGVIFVRGGAGTGKTTLLSSFLRETGLKNVCWMSIDSSNANVYSFWLYFTAAVTAFWEDSDTFLKLMQSNPDASHMEELLTVLINRLFDEEDYYMVLDDIHCIKDAALIRTFEFFLRAMPSNFHLFMLSREDPPIYLGPLAVSGRLLFIDGNQMQLTQEEGILFLKNTLKLSVSDEEIIELNTYAEGWVGGLQLAAAANALGKSSGQLLRAGGGIATEYLTREVLASLTKPEREFLTGTGFLSYFDYEICTALFHGLTKTDFENMVDGMIQKNLFIICMDEQAGIYRYHNILSEYLTQQFIRLPEQDKRSTYINAAKAFIQKEDYEEALREYYLAGEYQEVLRIANTMEGRIEAWTYLDKIPIDILILDADLAAQCFMFNFGNMNMERCRIIFEKFKDHYGDSDVFSIVRFLEIYITRNNAILPNYQVLSADQIEVLHFGPVAKAMLLVENSAALLEQTKYEEAIECVKNAIQTCAGSNVFIDFFAYNQLAQIYEEIGHLNESLLCYDKAKKLFMKLSMLTGIGANYYFGLAGVYMKRMELDKAEDMLEQSRLHMADKHIHLDVADLTLSYHLGEMNFLHGDDNAGASFVEGLRSEYPEYSVITLGRLLYELDCANKLTDNLADQFLKELAAAKNYRNQPYYRLIHARIIFKRGDIEEAMKETEEILTFSRLHKNKLHIVNAGLFKLFMLCNSSRKAGGKREINNLLYEAIHYAYEDRIMMPFYLERSTLLPLLCDFSEQISQGNIINAAEVNFINDVITICNGKAPISKGSELLSARELEVLAELSLGITNREIADKLSISPSTVKTHTLSIYSKFGVSSRIMAVDIGRREGLIQ